MPLRVLVLGDASSPHLLRWVCALEAEGLQTLTLSLEPPLPGYPRFAPLPVKFPRRIRYLLAAPEALEQAKAWQPDLIFAHFLPNYGLISTLLPLRVPKVLALWGSDLLLVPQSARWKFWVARKVLKVQDLVVVDARMLRDILRERFAIPSQKVWVLPYGLPRRIREATCSGTPDPTLIIHTRRLSPETDPWTVVAAMKRLRDRGSPLRLRMVGWGSLHASIRARVYWWGLYGQVRFVDPVPESQVQKLYCGGSLYLSASLSDSTSVSLLEAMALGLFPVVSDIPGNREWVVHGLNGFLFEPGNPEDLAFWLEEAFRREDLREQARRLNRELIQARASWEGEVARLVRKFSALVAEQQAPGW